MENNTFKEDRGSSSEGAQRWQAPEIVQTPAKTGAKPSGAKTGDAKPRAALPTAGHVEEIQRQAYQEAFEQGKREGQAKGAALVSKQADRLEKILGLLSAPLQQLDDQVVDEVVSLALAIARHIIRREIKSDPGQIIAVVREAAAVLPVATRRIQFFLHPEDAATVRESIGGASDQQSAWHIVEDPAMARGGCRLETEHSRIDATIEKRLAAIAAELLGGEREQDDVQPDD